MHQHRHEGGEYRRIELITGTVRRRRWTAAEKAALIAESLRPGINVSALARRSGVNRGLLQTWRRNAMRQAADQDDVFVPLRIERTAASTDTSASTCTSDASALPGSVPAEMGMIEIERGALRVRFCGPVDAGSLRLVLAHVGRRT